MGAGRQNTGPRFGANYVPSRGWFYSWLDFTPEDVRRDLEDLAALGLDHVRVFPIWPWVQPNRGHIRERAVADLLQTVDIAAELGLDVAVDLVQGHLSSFDFLPSWTITWHRRSVFQDPEVRAGLAAYVETVGQAVATRPNVFALTLGNEVNNLFPSNEVTPRTAREWADELLAVARASAPDLLAVHSLHDETFYVPGHPFAPVDTTDLGDVTSVHSWTFTGVGAIDAPLGPATLSHADYLIELASALSQDPRRPVWLQEVGAPRPDIPEDAATRFLGGTLGHVLDNPLLLGVTWWCSHDIDRTLVDFPEREYDLGLITVDHEVKPVGRALADVVSQARRSTPSVRGRRPALIAPHDLRDPQLDRLAYAPGSPFHQRWVELRSHGPVGVLSGGRPVDPAELDARGFELAMPFSPGELTGAR